MTDEEAIRLCFARGWVHIRDRNRKGRHHQLFTDDVGHPALAQHLYALRFMRASNSWNEFYRLVNRAFPKKGNNLELPFIEKASTATPI
jgi:hypothetical protein